MKHIFLALSGLRAWIVPAIAQDGVYTRLVLRTGCNTVR
jgi:hypothetical protein